MSVQTPEEISEKYAAQRAHLQTLLDDGLKELRSMADRRKALSCDVTTGKGGEHELETLERQMAAKTVETDRLRLSIDELGPREAQALNAANMARKAELRKHLDKQLADLAKATAAVADAIEALAKATMAAQLIEDLVGSLADQLDLRLDPFNIMKLVPQAIYENGLNLRNLNMVERGDVQRTKVGRADAPGLVPPTKQLRTKRVVSPAMHTHRDVEKAV